MCVLFYGQLSSFASGPSDFIEKNQDSDQSDFSSWLSKVSQFDSMYSFYRDSCYGLDMGAYEATWMQLCGPAIVLVASLLLTAVAQRMMPRFSNFFHKHKIEVRISLRATTINVILLLFSSVSSVIFQLITCTKIGEQDVIFIDGTRKCPWGLISVAVVLSVVPVVFWALLKFNKIPAPAKAAVCSAYTDSRYYWVAVTLIARFLMTVVFATVRDFPSLTAFGLLIFSIAMFGLLIFLRPYVEERTYYMDMFCYACLVVQFALQCLVRDSESLGVAVVESNIFRPTILRAARASSVIRFALNFFSLWDLHVS